MTSLRDLGADCEAAQTAYELDSTTATRNALVASYVALRTAFAIQCQGFASDFMGAGDINNAFWMMVLPGGP